MPRDELCLWTLRGLAISRFDVSATTSRNSAELVKKRKKKYSAIVKHRQEDTRETFAIIFTIEFLLSTLFALKGREEEKWSEGDEGERERVATRVSPRTLYLFAHATALNMHFSLVSDWRDRKCFLSSRVCHNNDESIMDGKKKSSKTNLRRIYFVAEEVFSSNEALWFSPSGSKLVFGYFDDTNTPIMTIPFYGYPGSLTFQYTSTIPIHYPKVSTYSFFPHYFVVLGTARPKNFMYF